MPSTPEVPPMNDVSGPSPVDARRLNALKNQRESDWFGHDAGSKTPSGSTPRPSTSGSRTPNRTSQESETWFRYDVSNGSSLPVGKSETEVKNRAKERVHGGSQQDWYKHGDGVPDPPSLDKKSKTRSRKSACAETRRKTMDPNEWFRHEHTDGAMEGNKAGKKPVKVTPPTALWAVYPDGGDNPAETPPRPKSRLTAPEADDYYRRDKLGSSTEWFSHEHPRESTSVSNVRVRGTCTAEGGEIASRLKGESEDWFNHEGNKGYVAPPPVVKGNSPFARELMERAQGREIKQIFQMEETLRSTWIAPPPLMGGTGDTSSPGLTPILESGPSSDAKNSTEKVQEKVDDSQKNGH